jgi:HEAT repeat protein
VASQPEVTKLAPELVNGVTNLARTLVAATRNCTLYPPGHPALLASFERLSEAIDAASHASVFSVAITPDNLLIDGLTVPPSPPILEAARLLHDCDLLQLTFSGVVPPEAVANFLQLLAEDRETVRQNGGPEEIWSTRGHRSITVEQIDYAALLANTEDPGAHRHDDVWTSIVRSMVGGATVTDEFEQRRLLEIATDPGAISDLIAALIATKCTADGAPMIMSQAATILAAYRHLASIVSVKEPEQIAAAIENLASATSTLDPHLILQIMRAEDDPEESVQLMAGLAAAFDDAKIAQLLATALAADGQATAKLAEVFDTIAPERERKRRVLTMTRTLLKDTSFGQSKQFKAIWNSMEDLCIAYNEDPFVSEEYRVQLDGARTRGDVAAGKDLPDEMPEWMESIGQQNVRKLSVSLIVDLLRLENDPVRAAEIATDMTALSEDLLLSGEFADARNVAAALNDAASNDFFAAPEACRDALAHVATSPAMHEIVAILGEIDNNSLTLFTDMCRITGAPTVDVLGMALKVAEKTPARLRASDIIVAIGAPAIPPLASFLEDDRAYVQCNAAEILGRIGSSQAVPLLVGLLRRCDLRVMRVAVSALAAIPHASAARAVHTVLRVATGDQRRVVIDSLVAGRDTRVVPILVCILNESEPLGRDHSVVLDTLAALRVVHSDSAVGPIARVARRRRWFARKRNRALKGNAVDALAAIGTDASTKALVQAAAEGDPLLRKLAKAKLAERAS